MRRTQNKHFKWLTVKREFRPHTTSFNFLVGAHPSPSIEFCLKRLRQISPSSLMFGCQSFVRHFTIGGWEIKNTHWNYSPLNKCPFNYYWNVVIFIDDNMKEKLSTFPETLVRLNDHREFMESIRILKLYSACGRNGLFHFLNLNMYNKTINNE